MEEFFTRCLECGRRHDPTTPHDLNSPRYQLLFIELNERKPTWEDAMSHCTQDVKDSWRASIARVKECTEKLYID